MDSPSVPKNPNAAAKQKWFIRNSPSTGINLDTVLTYPHVGSVLQTDTDGFSCTDGNQVASLIDGQSVMVTLYKNIIEMTQQAQSQKRCELWIANWTMNDFCLLGLEQKGALTLTSLLSQAAKAGVLIHILVSDHPLSSGKSFVSSLPNHQNIQWLADNRNLNLGSHHQKFYLTCINEHWEAILGSVDINMNRWDDSAHKKINTARPNSKPTHELAVLVTGPAVLDLACSFVERWNDPIHPGNISKSPSYTPIDIGKLKILPIESANATCSIQVLRTYPVNLEYGYSWSKTGEFGVWRSYLNAIRQAQKFIYIEDQYFLDAGLTGQEKTWFGEPGVSTMLCEALCDALSRGVFVIIILPAKSEDTGSGIQLSQRNACIKKLIATKTNKLIVRYPCTDAETFVHSKLMLVDDELVLVGSANFCRRSMTHDSEIQLAIVDSVNHFPQRLREALLCEHLNLGTIGENWLELLIKNNSNKGRLQDYLLGKVDEFSLLAWATPGNVTTEMFDPYGGPDQSQVMKATGQKK